ncbi:MAG: SGNH/GDSL hydrolase family protein [Clostridia bacterium]|nr:SGNH/GDSL hydrolase family protein [Clostridia bacterium]
MENKIKVTLLGDSIRLIGYGKHVPGMLGDNYNVFQPEDNCRFASYTLRMLFDYKEQIKGSDLIHWNDGLWDICDLFGDGPFTYIKEYTDTMKRIARVLTDICGKVVFATTTPVYPGNPYNDNAVIKRYNEAIVPELEKQGIVINDLYSAVAADIPKYIRSDDLLHLTEEGELLCARQTVGVIRSLTE